MSRTISLAVLLAVLAPSFLIFARLNAPKESQLPACCRRDGEHHCAMLAASEEASGTQVKAESPVCPFHSQATAAAVAIAYLPTSSAAQFAGLESHPAIHEQVHACRRVSEARSHQKRGPPLTL